MARILDLKIHNGDVYLSNLRGEIKSRNSVNHGSREIGEYSVKILFDDPTLDDFIDEDSVLEYKNNKYPFKSSEIVELSYTRNKLMVEFQ